MRLPALPDAPRPLLFAHRGLSALAPENTLAAFRLARERGIPGIELDVHRSKDGKLAVIHDDDTGRVAGAGSLPPGPDAKGRGLSVEGSDYAELSTLDVGAWKGAEFRGERIILLEELFEELGDSCYYDIELKARSREDTGLASAVARAIAEANHGKGLLERCIVSSFNPLALARFKAREPRVPTAIIWCRDEELPSYLRHGEGRWIGGVDLLKPAREKVRGLSSFRWRRLEGYNFLPWTVDDPAEAARLIELGALGLISNAPQALALD